MSCFRDDKNLVSGAGTQEIQEHEQSKYLSEKAAAVSPIQIIS